jgi:hypothetical protein
MHRTDSRAFEGDEMPRVTEDGSPVIRTPQTKGGRSMAELLAWAVARRGARFPNIPKQYAAMKRMKNAGVPPERIKDRWFELENDRFFKDKGIDFAVVASSFDRKP